MTLETPTRPATLEDLIAKLDRLAAALEQHTLVLIAQHERPILDDLPPIPTQQSYDAGSLGTPAPYAPVQPQAPAPQAQVCPRHHVPFRYKEGGYSERTQKTYPGFWACPEKDGRQWCPEKPR
jgi:hypothetical protein